MTMKKSAAALVAVGSLFVSSTAFAATEAPSDLQTKPDWLPGELAAETEMAEVRGSGLKEFRQAVYWYVYFASGAYQLDFAAEQVSRMADFLWAAYTRGDSWAVYVVRYGSFVAQAVGGKVGQVISLLTDPGTAHAPADCGGRACVFVD